MTYNNRENYIPRDLVDELEESYLNYSMSVIVSRALPDVRDGLKPVHRRILYGMNELGVQWNRPLKKCARIVGDVLGKYHPHGDASVYDALVRLAQDFAMRYPLAVGQGNFGSIDGDSAAAMRYTEARLSRLGNEMLRDLEKDTVEWTNNFDETLKEPRVLPAIVPNLLINGSEGIAVGMATKIPPHNLGEIIEATIHVIDNPECTATDLIKYVKGPDFPTGAIIEGMAGIREAYTTGRGKITVKARAAIAPDRLGKSQIIISEIPYQVNKSTLIETIAHLVRDKKIEGISDIRDESGKEGIRIVIETKRDAVAEVVLNQLYTYTQLKDTFGIIMLALVDGAPKLLNLKEIVRLFVEHRHEIIKKRTEFELREAEERAHILEGLKIALDNIDEVINIIKKSKDPDMARTALMKTFKLTERQSQAILDMRLQRLTGLEVEKVVQEYKETIKLISKLKGILASKRQRMEIIKEELREVSKHFVDERRTEIVAEEKEFDIEDMIAEENVVVTITHDGYIKRTPETLYRRQNRGGRGLQGVATREEDFVQSLLIANTHDFLLFFSDKGKCYWLKVYEIPAGGRTSKGRAIVNLIGCDAGERIEAYVSVREFDEERFIVMATQKGLVKKTALSKYSKPRKGGIFAIEIEAGDKLINAKITHGNDDIILGTKEGKSIRFSERQIRSTGRKTKGVRGIRLSRHDDKVVGMVVVQREGTILVATENGYGKRTSVNEYRMQRRGGKGVMAMRTTEKVGKMVAILEVVNDDDIMTITDKGVLIRQPVKQIRTIGRVTQGVRLIRLDPDTKITSVTQVVPEEKRDDSGESPGEAQPVETTK